MSDNDSYVRRIVATYPQLLSGRYCVMALSALLWSDFALTFPREIRRLWGHGFTSATLVYVFTRYPAIVDRVLLILEIFIRNSSDQTCGRISRAVSIPTKFPTQRCQYVSSTIYHKENWEVDVTTPVSQIATTMTIAPNAILLCLTWIKTFSIHKVLSRNGMRTTLTALLLHDGTAFFVILLLSRIVAVISKNLHSTSLLLVVWPSFDEVLGPIFLSRFLFNACGLRFSDHRSHMDIPYADSTISAAFEMSEIRFTTSRVLGNLSMTLSDPGTPGTSLDVESCCQDPYDLDIEEFELELSGPPGITESTLSARAL